MNLQEVQTLVAEERAKRYPNLDAWATSGFFQKMRLEYDQDLAIMLANQRQMNNNMEEDYRIPFLRMVAEGWRASILPKIVSVQPMYGPTSPTFYRGRGGEYRQHDMPAKTRNLKMCYSGVVGEEQIDFLVDILGQEFGFEFNIEIISNIRDNTKLTQFADFKEFKNPGEDIQRVMLKLAEDMTTDITEFYDDGRKYRPNWAIISADVATLIRTGKWDMDDTTLAPSVWTKHSIPNLTVIVDKFLPSDEILIGFKGNAYESGLIFSPYVPFSHTSTLVETDTFFPRRVFMSRYGKRLIDGGPCFYGKIKIANMPVDYEPLKYDGRIEVITEGKNEKPLAEAHPTGQTEE